MRKTLFTGLVALVAACGSEDARRPLSYGSPQAPTYDEQSAGSTAQTTLQGSLTFAPTTEPTYGAMGLGDQLLMSLGAYTVGAPAPTAKLQKAAGRAISRAFDTGGMNPACVTTTATSATWSGCVIEMTDTDPYSGDTTYMRVTIDGTLGWSAGVTTWNIFETIAMTMTSGPDTITMNGTATLAGEITVTSSTITGQTRSSVGVTESYMGMTFGAAVDTNLALDLEYQPDPFCVTGGTLTLEQVWTQRPYGATPELLPDQGWRFEWAGCNVFTVSHGG